MVKKMIHSCIYFSVFHDAAERGYSSSNSSKFCFYSTYIHVQLLRFENPQTYNLQQIRFLRDVIHLFIDEKAS